MQTAHTHIHTMQHAIYTQKNTGFRSCTFGWDKPRVASRTLTFSAEIKVCNLGQWSSHGHGEFRQMHERYTLIVIDPSMHPNVGTFFPWT